MKRKIIKIGNSLGIIIPSAFLEELEVGYKDEVEIEYDSEFKIVTIRNVKTTPIDNHLEKVIKDVVDTYLKDKGL